MELLKECEEEEKNSAPDDVVDYYIYYSCDLYCEEVDEEDYDLCSCPAMRTFDFVPNVSKK